MRSHVKKNRNSHNDRLGIHQALSHLTPLLPPPPVLHVTGGSRLSKPSLASNNSVKIISVPSETPQNVYARDEASATKIYVSWQSPPVPSLHGILRGYFIWYSIIRLGINDKTPVFPRDYVKKQLSASSNDDVLIDLESYAKYDIKIAAFTSKGHGPTKDITTS